MRHSRVVIRSSRATDLRAVERITVAAYGVAIGPSLRMRVRTEPDAVLVAENDGNVCGLVAFSRYGRAAYIASMAVDPALQRRGIARTLMAEVIARLQSDGIETMMLDATDEGAPLYASFGFSERDLTYVYERSWTAKAEAKADSSARGSLHDFEHALALDREIAGCDRSSVLRAFANEPGARTIVDDDGYAIAREHVLGPWIARTPASASTLFYAALHLSPALARVFAPASNAAALALLETHAFHRTRTLRHMIRGHSPMLREHIYGEASPGHG